MRILIISPIHDIPTIISSAAVDNLIKWINKKNKQLYEQGRKLIEFKALRHIEANRLSLWFYRDYDAIFYYGHGLKDRLIGSGFKVFPMLDKKNCHWFEGSIIYTMACYSGRELSHECINNGVRAYFGQTTQYFGFLPDIKKKYLEDWYTLVNIIPISLMLGETCGEALRKYEALANTLRAKYLNKPPSINSKLLFSNALNMELYGDNSATLP